MPRLGSIVDCPTGEDCPVTTMEGIKVGVAFFGALAVGVVIVPLVGLIGANVELVGPPPTVCVWPRASKTEKSKYPAKTKTETRLLQIDLDMILFHSIVDLGQTAIFHN